MQPVVEERTVECVHASADLVASLDDQHEQQHDGQEPPRSHRATEVAASCRRPHLEAEMSEHLGYGRHDPAGRDGANSRNGTRTKTVLTEIGPVQIEIPRDRDASFDPVSCASVNAASTASTRSCCR